MFYIEPAFQYISKTMTRYTFYQWEFEPADLRFCYGRLVQRGDQG